MAPHYKYFDFKLTSDAKIGHELVTLYVQFLCSDWSKFDSEFMQKIYAASWKLFT